MPSIIEVPDELLALLHKNAAAQGKDVNSYAVAALSKAAQQDADQNPSPATRPGKPLAQYINEQREKHNLPADWCTGKDTPLTDEEWAEIDNAFAEIYMDISPADVK